MLSRLFIAALWSPTGKRLTSWLLFVMFNCVFVTFPCGILGQVWYLIVSIPDLCHLSYFTLKQNASFERSNESWKCHALQTIDGTWRLKVIYHTTVNVLKLQTLIAFLSQIKVGYKGWHSQNACQNSKEGRPKLDSFSRSSLIWVYAVCLGQFGRQDNSVWNCRTSTIYTIQLFIGPDKQILIKCKFN